MIDAAILDDDDPVELIEGLLCEKHVEVLPCPPDDVDLGELFRLTAERFHAMVRVGILTANDGFEFVEGLLLNRMTILPPHTGTVIGLNTVLKPMLPPGWRYRQEQPVLLGTSEPLPDGAIARGSDADNYRFHPSARDVLIVIEVADATLVRDRGIKLRSYARAGIPVYWVVNLIDRQVEVYTDPDPAAEPHPTYRGRVVYTADAAVPLSVGGVALPPVPVAAVLPPE